MIQVREIRWCLAPIFIVYNFPLYRIVYFLKFMERFVEWSHERDSFLSCAVALPFLSSNWTVLFFSILSFWLLNVMESRGMIFSIKKEEVLAPVTHHLFCHNFLSLIILDIY